MNNPLHQPLTVDRTATHPPTAQKALSTGDFFDSNLYRAGIRGYLCNYHAELATPVAGTQELLHTPCYQFNSTPAFKHWLQQLQTANAKLNAPVELDSLVKSNKTTLIAYLQAEEQIIQRYVSQFADLPLHDNNSPSDTVYGRPGDGVAQLMVMDYTYASDVLLVSYFFNRHKVRSDKGKLLTYNEWLVAMQPKDPLPLRLVASLQDSLIVLAWAIAISLYFAILPFAIVIAFDAPPIALIAIHTLMVPLTVALYLYFNPNNDLDACASYYSINLDERLATVVNTFADKVYSWRSLLVPRNFEQRYTLRAYYLMMQRTATDNSNTVQQQGYVSYTHLHVKDFARMALSQLDKIETMSLR